MTEIWVEGSLAFGIAERRDARKAIPIGSSRTNVFFSVSFRRGKLLVYVKVDNEDCRPLPLRSSGKSLHGHLFSPSKRGAGRVAPSQRVH